MMVPRGGRTASGFTLIEALVALAILGLALLLGLGLVWQQRRVLVRLEAREIAEGALVEALETLRSGAVPLASGAVPVTGAGADDTGAVSAVVLVTPIEPPAGLYRGQVVVRSTVGGETVTRKAETQFWRPGKLRSH